MAFAARPAQVNGMEENAAKDGAKGLGAAKTGQSLLQQGSKRRAPLGDMSNLVGPLNGRSAVGKDGAAKVAEPSKPRTLSTRSTSKEAPGPASEAVAVQQPQAAMASAAIPARSQQTGQTAAAIPGQPLARTRSQTMAMARQQVAGPSMTSLLQSRSEQAASSKKPTISAPPSPLPNIEQASDMSNPLAATEYVNDIYSYFKRIEPRYRVQAGYMSRQTDINERMRAILIDWLVEVHLKFKLMPETLYLTVNLIDRFLESKAVTRKNLQLVGVTAMLIGSKYEEIWAPEVRDFVYISDKAYTREQILAMEKLMLNTLQFNLTLPTAHNFLARFIKAAGNDRKVLTLATYLAELAMVDAGMLNYSYSVTSAAALYVAARALGSSDPYPHALARHSGYSRQNVLPCAQALVRLMQKAPTHSLSAVFKKYSTPKQMEVATTPPPIAILEEVVIAPA